MEEQRPKGLYKKYIIAKSSGEPVDPAAEYFVLRIDTDVWARQALRCYAHFISESNPILARELHEWLLTTNYTLAAIQEERMALL